MPAKIRTIRASSVSEVELFDFNKSINYKGETLSKFILKEKKTGIFNVKVFQDLDGDHEMTKSDLIFKGKIINVEDTDDLTNFVGSIKLKKQMHNCEWALQKLSKSKEPEISDLICTADYIPTIYDFMLKSDLTGKKYYFDGVGDFKPEGIVYVDEPNALRVCEADPYCVVEADFV